MSSSVDDEQTPDDALPDYRAMVREHRKKRRDVKMTGRPPGTATRILGRPAIFGDSSASVSQKSAVGSPELADIIYAEEQAIHGSYVHRVLSAREIAELMQQGPAALTEAAAVAPPSSPVPVIEAEPVDEEAVEEDVSNRLYQLFAARQAARLSDLPVNVPRIELAVEPASPVEPPNESSSLPGAPADAATKLRRKTVFPGVVVRKPLPEVAPPVEDVPVSESSEAKEDRTRVIDGMVRDTARSSGTTGGVVSGDAWLDNKIGNRPERVESEDVWLNDRGGNATIEPIAEATEKHDSLFETENVDAPSADSVGTSEPHSAGAGGDQAVGADRATVQDTVVAETKTRGHLAKDRLSGEFRLSEALEAAPSEEKDLTSFSFYQLVAEKTEAAKSKAVEPEPVVADTVDDEWTGLGWGEDSEESGSPFAEAPVVEASSFEASHQTGPQVKPPAGVKGDATPLPNTPVVAPPTTPVVTEADDWAGLSWSDEGNETPGSPFADDEPVGNAVNSGPGPQPASADATSAAPVQPALPIMPFVEPSKPPVPPVIRVPENLVKPAEPQGSQPAGGKDQPPAVAQPWSRAAGSAAANEIHPPPPSYESEGRKTDTLSDASGTTAGAIVPESRKGNLSAFYPEMETESTEISAKPMNRVADSDDFFANDPRLKAALGAGSEYPIGEEISPAKAAPPAVKEAPLAANRSVGGSPTPNPAIDAPPAAKDATTAATRSVGGSPTPNPAIDAPPAAKDAATAATRSAGGSPAPNPAIDAPPAAKDATTAATRSAGGSSAPNPAIDAPPVAKDATSAATRSAGGSPASNPAIDAPLMAKTAPPSAKGAPPAAKDAPPAAEELKPSLSTTPLAKGSDAAPRVLRYSTELIMAGIEVGIKAFTDSYGRQIEAYYSKILSLPDQLYIVSQDGQFAQGFQLCDGEFYWGARHDDDGSVVARMVLDPGTGVIVGENLLTGSLLRLELDGDRVEQVRTPAGTKETIYFADEKNSRYTTGNPKLSIRYSEFTVSGWLIRRDDYLNNGVTETCFFDANMRVAAPERRLRAITRVFEREGIKEKSHEEFSYHSEKQEAVRTRGTYTDAAGKVTDMHFIPGEDAPNKIRITDSFGFTTQLSRNAATRSYEGTCMDRAGNVLEEVVFDGKTLTYKRKNSQSITRKEQFCIFGVNEPKVELVQFAAPVWNADIAASVSSAPTGARRLLYPSGRKDVIEKDGTIKWEGASGERSFAAPGGEVLVTNTDGGVIRLHRNYSIEVKEGIGGKFEKSVLAAAEQDFLNKHRFKLDMRDYAEFSRQWHSRADKLESVLRQLDLMSAARYREVPPEQLEIVRNCLLHHIAYPDEIYQGHAATCGAAVIQRLFAADVPFRYAAMIREALTGRLSIAGSVVLDLDLQNLLADDLSGRDITTRLFQTMVSRAAVHPDFDLHNSWTGVGEDAAGRAGLRSAMTAEDVSSVIHKLSGIETLVLEINCVQDLRQAYVLNGKRSMIIGVQGDESPFGFPGQAERQFVTVSGVLDGRASRFLICNQFGAAQDHSTRKTALDARSVFESMIRCAKIAGEKAGVAVIHGGQHGQRYKLVNGKLVKDSSRERA